MSNVDMNRDSIFNLKKSGSSKKNSPFVNFLLLWHLKTQTMSFMPFSMSALVYWWCCFLSERIILLHFMWHICLINGCQCPSKLAWNCKFLSCVFLFFALVEVWFFFAFLTRVVCGQLTNHIGKKNSISQKAKPKQTKVPKIHNINFFILRKKMYQYFFMG